MRISDWSSDVCSSDLIDAWVAQIQNPASEAGFTSLLLGAIYIDATSLAAWSALYFAINYFLQLEEQNDRVIRLEAQAASAQLAMLRYQLHPHFLFNKIGNASCRERVCQYG